MPKGVTYFIQEGMSSVFKIGATEQGSDWRIKELQTGNSKKLRVFGEIESDNPFRLERSLQNKFSNAKLNGEWYAIEPQVIAELIELNKGRLLVAAISTELEIPNKVVSKLSEDVKLNIQNEITWRDREQIRHEQYRIARAKAFKRQEGKNLLISLLLGLCAAFVFDATVVAFICGMISDIRHASWASIYMPVVCIVSPFAIIFFTYAILQHKTATVTQEDIDYEYSLISSFWKKKWD